MESTDKILYVKKRRKRLNLKCSHPCCQAITCGKLCPYIFKSVIVSVNVFKTNGLGQAKGTKNKYKCGPKPCQEDLISMEPWVLYTFLSVGQL